MVGVDMRHPGRPVRVLGGILIVLVIAGGMVLGLAVDTPRSRRKPLPTPSGTITGGLMVLFVLVAGVFVVPTCIAAAPDPPARRNTVFDPTIRPRIGDCLIFPGSVKERSDGSMYCDDE